jgi:hypothetical protein
MNKRRYNGDFTVKDKILNRINDSKENVFIPTDFKGITTYPQIIRALKQLTDEKIIIRLGYGSYSKADLNPFNNKLCPVGDNVSTALELFKKLNVKWDYSKAVKDYNSGISTQVPVRNYLVIQDRFSRKLNVLGSAYVIR